MSDKSKDFSKVKENISSIQTSISQINNEFQMQDQIFDQFAKLNEQLKNNLDILDQNLDSLLNLETDSIDEEDSNVVDTEFIKPDNATFNMENKTITYKNQIYQYNVELIYETANSINDLVKHFNQIKDKDIFPQGVDYCETLLNQQKESNNKIIILYNSTPKHNTWFYFILNDIKQLSCTQGWRIVGKKSFSKQIALLKEYRSDNYPQGFEYCQFLLNEQFRKNGCVHIVARNNGSVWTRYYFVSEMLRIIPNENLNLVIGKNKLKDAIKLVDKTKNDDYYPQGIEYCQNLLKSQYEINGQVLVIGGTAPDGRYMWNYYPPEQIVLACNTEWWYKSKESLDTQIRLIDERSRIPESVYTQGKEYCKNLIREQRDNGGGIHLLVRNSINNYWFCFKA